MANTKFVDRVEKRGREKIKLDVERFIDLTSKSHRSSTNSVISGTNSLGKGFLKFQTRATFRQTTKLHFSLFGTVKNGRFIRKVDVAEVDHIAYGFF